MISQEQFREEKALLLKQLDLPIDSTCSVNGAKAENFDAAVAQIFPTPEVPA